MNIIILLQWMLGFFLFWRRNEIQESYDFDKDKKISIIIPARNEEKNIGNLLESLKDQSIQIDEIIVVDDQSSDKTASIAKSFGVSVLQLKDLPDGWIGKSNACWNGYKFSTGDILIFLDADVTLSKNAVKSLLKVHQKYGGLISTQPWHNAVRVHEKLSAMFNIIAVMSMKEFSAIGFELKPIGSFGPCLVCSRKDYETSGGHEKIKNSVVDDVAIAKSFMKSALPVHNFLGGKLITFRMYPESLKSLVEGWTKNFATGASRSNPLFFLMIFLWISGYMNIIIYMNKISLAFYAFLYAVYAFQFYIFSRRVGNFGVISALFFPVHVFFFVFIFVYSLIRTFLFRNVDWKGRKIKTGGIS
ncbi:MAG: glycosyltransferase [Athalassotoga sp.]|uniref:glycosyltransferase n=1 Tax=Athalassotoga sp. TaxID=2022597 RepID=UPI003D00473C